jgi:hypothetical protein
MNISDAAFTRVHLDETMLDARFATYRGVQTWDGSGDDIDAQSNPLLLLSNFQILTDTKFNGIKNLTSVSDIDQIVYGNIPTPTPNKPDKIGGVLSVYTDHYTNTSQEFGKLKSQILIGSVFMSHDGGPTDAYRYISTPDQSLKIRYEMKWDSDLKTLQLPEVAGRYAISKFITGPGYDDNTDISDATNLDTATMIRSVVNSAYSGTKPAIDFVTGSRYAMANAIFAGDPTRFAKMPINGAAVSIRENFLAMGIEPVTDYSTPAINTSTLMYNTGYFSIKYIDPAGATSNYFTLDPSGRINFATANLTTNISVFSASSTATAAITNPVIDLNGSTSVHLHGGNLALAAYNGTTGGTIDIAGGNSSANTGGYLSMSAGNGSTTGGYLALAAGHGTTGDGGRIQAVAGNSAAAIGGLVEMRAGNGVTSGGTVYLNAGNGTAAGGNITVQPGTGIANGKILLNGNTTVASGSQLLVNTAGELTIGYSLQVSGNSTLYGKTLINTISTLTSDPSYALHVNTGILLKNSNAGFVTNYLQFAGDGGTDGYVGNYILTEIRTTNGHGQGLYIETSDSKSNTTVNNYVGGEIQLIAGDGHSGVSTNSHTGPRVTGRGGAIYLTPGNGGDVTGTFATDYNAGIGGSFQMITGEGGSIGLPGQAGIRGAGNFNLVAGDSGGLAMITGPGGSCYVSGNSSYRNYAGGSSSIYMASGIGGDGSTTVSGGNTQYVDGGWSGGITLETKSAGDGSIVGNSIGGTSGNVEIKTGNSGSGFTPGTVGYIKLLAGNGGTGPTCANGGDITIQTGNGGAGVPSGNGGDLTLTLGSGAAYGKLYIIGLSSASVTNIGVDVNNRVWKATSSLRYKKNITDISNDDYDKIYGLRPIVYTGINDNICSYGFIAEEAVEILDKLVMLDTEGNPESFHYDKLTALLVGAMKKLKAENEQLKADIAAIKQNLGI